MKKNSSGTILTVFLVIAAVLLVTLLGVTLFYLKKEEERRKLAETGLEKSMDVEARLEESLGKVKNENFLLLLPFL